MRRPLAALAALLVAPALARAQTTTGASFTVTESNDQDRIVNIAECQSGQDTLSFAWVVPSTNFVAGGTYDLLASDIANCPLTSTNSAAHTVFLAQGLSASSSSASFPASGQSPISVSTLLPQVNVPNCTAGTATTVFFCVNYTPPGGTVVTVTGNIPVDLAVPATPLATGTTAGDGALTVKWQQGTGAADAGTVGAAAGYKVYCGVSGGTLTLRATVTTAGTLSTRVGGLQNGTAYDCQVTATSLGNNESARSNTVTGTPVEILDFWRLYQADGGREQGGCALGAGGLLALLALVPLALRRRGRRS